MSSFKFFCDNCKMRHDFSDQIQVRYTHVDGLDYDTWVSGEEVINRLQSAEAEEELEGLSDLEWEQLQVLKDQLPDLGRRKFKESLQTRLVETLDDFMGGSPIGDNFVDAVRTNLGVESEQLPEDDIWKSLIKDELFRLKTLTLAWIQLRGSFPVVDLPSEPDDWI